MFKFLALALSLTTACSDANFGGGALAAKNAAKDAKDGQAMDKALPPEATGSAASPSTDSQNVVDSAAATAPAQISGAYLVCAVVYQANTDVTSSVVGCKMNLPNGTRADAAASGVRFDYSVATISGITMTQASGGMYYDAFINFKATTLEAANSAGLTAKISVAVTDTATGKVYFKSERSPANDVPAASFAARGNWTGFGNRFRNDFNGVLWAADDQVAYTYDQAVAHCAALDVPDVGGGWRLPALIDMALAYDDGLGDVFAEVQNMNFDSDSRTIFWSTDEVDASQARGMNLKKTDPGFGQITSIAKTVQTSVVCLHDP